MSPFSAAVLFLLVSGVCAGQWRRRGDHDHRRRPWQPRRIYVDVEKTTPPPPLQCAGVEVPVPCDELRSAGVNRRCPYQPSPYQPIHIHMGCNSDDWRLGALCACPQPYRWTCAATACPPTSASGATVPTRGRPAAAAAWPSASSAASTPRPRRTCRACAAGAACTDTTPAPVVCSGNKELVRCGDMKGADLDRWCPSMEPYYGGRKTYCIQKDEWLGGKCACKPPNRIGQRQECVPMEKCPKCPAKERYSLCQANCEPTCGVPMTWIWIEHHCPRECKSGCVCSISKGYKRDKASGKCVQKDKCPDVAPESGTHNLWPRAVPIHY